MPRATAPWFLCLFFAWLAAAEAQVGGSYRIGNTGGRYEALYGEPEHWPLSDIVEGQLPKANRSIWTQGVLQMVATGVRLCVEGELRWTRTPCAW